MKSRLSLALLWVVCFSFASFAAAGTTPILKRGVNVSSWLANAPRQTLLAKDFIRLKAAGFDNVRLPFNPQYYGFRFGVGGADAVNLIPLDKAISLAMQSGLSVVLDVHPNSEFHEALENNPAAEKQFADLWIVLAKRYRSLPPSSLAYELLNEPQYYGHEAHYMAFARELVNRVRSIDKSHLIIVGAPRGSSIEGLLMMDPIADAHIAYDFHFYEPYIITHQGIHMGFEDKMIRYFRHLPYPSYLVRGNAGAYTEKAPNPMQAQSELEEYVHAKWNADRIASRIREAKDWAERHKARILCGEFGVLRNHIDVDSRYRWIRDVRAALEHDHIGWQLWDYTDGFGIATLHGRTATDPDGAVKLVDASKGWRELEPKALTALGLK